jgi:A/G-specific adenine glycosylase
VRHGFTHFKITLHAFTCRYASNAEPQALGVRAYAWVTPDQFDAYSFGKADRQVIEALRTRGEMLL